MSDIPISFGDTVRVQSTSTTKAAGFANLIGTVYGETMPSVSGVDVIGDISDDYAINVHFDALDTSAWFEPTLLQFVDHGAGQEITLDGVDKKWVRNDDGEWLEQPGNTFSKKRPWWKFW